MLWSSVFNADISGGEGRGGKRRGGEGRGGEGRGGEGRGGEGRGGEGRGGEKKTEEGMVNLWTSRDLKLKSSIMHMMSEQFHEGNFSGFIILYQLASREAVHESSIKTI